MRAVQKNAHLGNLEKCWTWELIFTCKDRRRYNRERAESRNMKKRITRTPHFEPKEWVSRWVVGLGRGGGIQNAMTCEHAHEIYRFFFSSTGSEHCAGTWKVGAFQALTLLFPAPAVRVAAHEPDSPRMKEKRERNCAANASKLFLIRKKKMVRL